MSVLSEIYALREGRESSKWDGYFPVYDRHFAPFRDQPVFVWEIGVYKGGSLELWRDYFSLANILGIDINPAAQFSDRRIEVFVGDQADPVFLKDLRKRFSPTIVIDDGGHEPEKMIASFEALWPVPVYVVEDCGRFVEYAKTRVNHAHVCFYNNIVVFEPLAKISKVDSGRK